ncbi:DUF3566 domain-containing protein [Streptomyces sp. NPDC051162]|uniref:DUF3566 domain-containing protein n=1 Tax=Streptomyces sp. NPDC051162 TaxID=3154747 RepID=UPI003417BEA6
MTDTRDPKPYHPPKAYEPPAEGSASGSGSTSPKGSKDGKAAKAAKEPKNQATAEDAGKSGDASAGEPAEKASAAAAKAPAAAQGAPASKGPAKGRPPAQRAAEEEQPRAPRPAAPAAAAARPAPRTRSARLRVAKADPWSVMKVSFLLSIALGVCTIVAAAVLWTVMDAMGVISTVGGTISDATTSSEGGGFDLQSFLSLPNVLLFTSVIAVIDVVLATALATLGAFVYNLSAGFVGGVELTLAEDE